MGTDQPVSGMFRFGESRSLRSMAAPRASPPLPNPMTFVIGERFPLLGQPIHGILQSQDDRLQQHKISRHW
jgi:hypothetical protein